MIEAQSPNSTRSFHLVAFCSFFRTPIPAQVPLRPVRLRFSLGSFSDPGRSAVFKNAAYPSSDFFMQPPHLIHHLLLISTEYNGGQVLFARSVERRIRPHGTSNHSRLQECPWFPPHFLRDAAVWKDWRWELGGTNFWQLARRDEHIWIRRPPSRVLQFQRGCFLCLYRISARKLYERAFSPRFYFHLTPCRTKAHFRQSDPLTLFD